MSGEATPRPAPGPEALDRAFGPRARCNRCEAISGGYRVIALFLHDTAAVRAYCASCYEFALEGEYHARGDGLLVDWSEFARRFGPPGVEPRPATPPDRTLGALLRAADVGFLAPPSECLARRRGGPPYAVDVAFTAGDQRARFLLGEDGTVSRVEGDELACRRVRDLVGSLSPR